MLPRDETQDKKKSSNGSMKKRNQFPSDFKAKVVLKVLREEAAVNEIAARYEIHPVMVSRWKQGLFLVQETAQPSPAEMPG